MRPPHKKKNHWIFLDSDPNLEYKIINCLIKAIDFYEYN